MVRRRQRPVSWAPENAPMVMLVLPASSARSIGLDRPHAAGQDFRHGSIILPEQQKTGSIESVGHAFEDRIVLIDTHAAALRIS